MILRGRRLSGSPGQNYRMRCQFYDTAIGVCMFMPQTSFCNRIYNEWLNTTVSSGLYTLYRSTIFWDYYGCVTQVVYCLTRARKGDRISTFGTPASVCARVAIADYIRYIMRFSILIDCFVSQLIQNCIRNGASPLNCFYKWWMRTIPFDKYVL